MSNMSKYIEDYKLKLWDYNHKSVSNNLENIHIFSKSIVLNSITLYNNEPNKIFNPNKATEIIYLGYIYIYIYIRGIVDNQDYYTFFLNRLTIHGKLKKGISLSDEHLKNLIFNRFILAKDKYDVRVIDFSYSQFYRIDLKTVPEEMLDWFLDNWFLDNCLESVNLNFIRTIYSTCPRLSKSYKLKLGTLFELTSS